MKRKYKLTIAYDGTSYSGWQCQQNAVGIQQVVEEALTYFEGAAVRIFGSSRTDAGVHARGFVAHFHLSKPIPRLERPLAPCNTNRLRLLCA